MTFASVFVASAMLAAPQDPFGGTQPTEPVARLTMAEGGVDVPANSMDEHIEVLRQILRRKLRWPAGVVSPASDPITYYGGQTTYTSNLLAHRGYLAGSLDGGDHSIEGVHLPGYGVVFTATLPSSRRDGKVAETKPESKPLSDWERTQKELRGEKVETVANQPTRGPSLREVIAQALADNGRHLSKLRDDERLTVVITFRDGAAGTNFFNPVTTNTESLFGAYVNQYVNQSGQATLASPSGAAPALAPAQAGKHASSARDYWMLGDMHMKQQQYESALEWFRKAYSTFEGELTSPDERRDKLGEMLRRQAQALIALGKYAEAQDALARLQALREAKAKERVDYLLDGKAKVATSTAKSGQHRLPTKMIVSATKRQLDQVASGKMSAEEFRKAISVEEE